MATEQVETTKSKKKKANGVDKSKEAAEQAKVVTEADENKISKEEQLKMLKTAHDWFSNFNHVPGAIAAQYAQALDLIALVNNAIDAEHREGK